MVTRDLQPGLDHLKIAADFPGISVEKLYELFASPQLITKWWPPLATMDVRVGGTYALSWPDQGWHLRGAFTQVEPNVELAFTWNWDHAPHLLERVVNLQFRSTANGAELTIIQGPYTAISEDVIDRESHVAGWQYFVGRLQERLEEGII